MPFHLLSRSKTSHSMELIINNYTVYIEDDVLEKLRSFRQTDNNSHESGGILLGKRIKNKNIYYIVDLSKPNKYDSSSRFGFVRNAKAAQRYIKKAWKNSDGYVNYIGEWHTHPEPCPSPSSTDRNCYITISKEKSSPFQLTINIIYGNANAFYICGYKDKNMIFERTINEQE